MRDEAIRKRVFIALGLHRPLNYRVLGIRYQSFAGDIRVVLEWY